MKAVVEGLLFIVGEDGIDIETISNILGESKEESKKLIEELENDYSSEERGITIKKFGNLYKLTTKKEHKQYYNKLADIPNIKNLSQSSLETLAIIAYNEPITRPEIDELRGVNSTQIITQSTPVINSQLPATTSVVNSTPVVTAPVTSQQISYAPIVSAIQKPKTGAKPVVKVVPIYDEF